MDAATLETLRQIELAELMDTPVRLGNSPVRRRLERARLIRGDLVELAPAATKSLRDRRSWRLTEAGRRALAEFRARPAHWHQELRKPELALPDPRAATGNVGASRKDLLAYSWLTILMASQHVEKSG